jgi:hypothetical protein
MQEGGEKGVGMYQDSTLTEYFGEYSLMAKSFRITGGRSTEFNEYANFCMQWMMLQQNLYAVTKIRGNLIIAG